MVQNPLSGQNPAVTVGVAADTAGFQDKIEAATSQLKSFRGAARLAGGALAALGAGGIAASVSKAAELESAFAEVSTLMESNADAAEVFGDKVAHLTTEFAVNGGQIKTVNALYDVLSAGFNSTSGATVVLEESLKSARAGLADAATTADLTTTILNGYGLQAQEASRVSDVLFATIQEGKTRLDELAGSLGRVVPAAAEVGVEIEEVGAAVATLTAQGQSTSEATTALNRVLTDLIKPTGDATDVIRRMGFESGRALVEQRGLAGALETVANHADTSGDSIDDVFSNVRSLRAALPLAQGASEDFAKNLDAMEDSAGAADEAFSEVSDTARFEFQQAVNGVRESLTQTGETFLPTATSMLSSTNSLIKGFNRLNKATDGTAGQLGLLASVAGGAGLALGSTAAIVAGASAAAFVAYSENMAGIRDTTSRTVEDVSSSLSRLTGNIGEETNKQMSFLKGFEVVVATGFDTVGIAFSNFVDGIVGFVETAIIAFQELSNQAQSVLSGEGLDMESAQQSLTEMQSMNEELGARVEDRFSGLQGRNQQRRVAIGQRDSSLLPKNLSGGGSSQDTAGSQTPEKGAEETVQSVLEQSGLDGDFQSAIDQATGSSQSFAESASSAAGQADEAAGSSQSFAQSASSAAGQLDETAQRMSTTGRRIQEAQRNARRLKELGFEDRATAQSDRAERLRSLSKSMARAAVKDQLESGKSPSEIFGSGATASGGEGGGGGQKVADAVSGVKKSISKVASGKGIGQAVASAIDGARLRLSGSLTLDGEVATMSDVEAAIELERRRQRDRARDRGVTR